MMVKMMVKIVVLLENTTESSKLKCKHGLSLYAETEKHKILFDMGPNDFFLRNAETLGVDIADIDIAVISHGHVDHCGGLKYFLGKTRKRKFIFARRHWKSTMSKSLVSLFMREWTERFCPQIGLCLPMTLM